MLKRKDLEELEKEYLSEYATLSSESKGREFYEDEDEYRTIFQRDRDRVIHSKAFRRLKHKTQVFISPEDDHFRTRLTHTLEVAQISRTIARALALNEDLTEAIALAHDLGHTPFGHCGEAALNRIHKGGFMHNVQGVRVVEKLERRMEYSYRGLNLSFEVRNGILNHRSGMKPATLEGMVVQLSDKIAYLNHDFDDACRAGILNEDDIPSPIRVVLGSSAIDRLDTMVRDVIENSSGKDRVSMSDEVAKASKGLREFMFKHLYRNSVAKAHDHKADGIIVALYNYFAENPNMMNEVYREEYKESGIEAVKDYIAGMTDKYVVKEYEKIFIPKGWD